MRLRRFGSRLIGAVSAGLVFGAVSLFSQAPAGEEADVPLGVLLESLSRFEHGADDAALLALEARVRSVLNDPGARSECETALIAFLDGEATSAGRQAVCREIALVGTERAVPVLERMLAAEGTSDMARCALEAIPGARADAALIRGLSVLSGRLKAGVISSLGNRKCAAAVPALERLLRSSAAAEAGAAAEALGRIGGAEAAGVLSSFLPLATVVLRGHAGAALLACADELLARGETSQASAAFGAVLKSGATSALRDAAFRGKVAAEGPGGQALVLAALGGEPRGLILPAIDMISVAFDRSSVSKVFGLLSRLPETGQVRLVAALSSFPGTSVLGILKTAANSPYSSVRIEALRSLGAAGDGSIILLLASRAADAAGPEQVAARESLRRLAAADVDLALLGAMSDAGPGPLRIELIRAIGERGAREGKDALLALARSGEPQERLQAVRALGRLAQAEDLPSLLDLLAQTRDEDETEEIANAIASTARVHGHPDARDGAVLSRYEAAPSPEERAALLRVLGKIGEDRSLPVVRRALDDAAPIVVDGAVRAVAGWPGAVARDDAIRIVRGSGNVVHRVLALEGYIRMIGLEPFRAPEGAVASLREALALAVRPEERRLIVAALPSFPCPAALALAEELSSSADIAPEARLAAEAIRKRLETDER